MIFVIRTPLFTIISLGVILLPNRSPLLSRQHRLLDARALHHDNSLADLYNETVMPKELRKAHENNDKAVLKAYEFSPKMSEQEIVGELMKMYERLEV